MSGAALLARYRDGASLASSCTAIADQVVPEYRADGAHYPCHGTVAKRWQAAWDAACLALGGDPVDHRMAKTAPAEAVPAIIDGPNGPELGEIVERNRVAQPNLARLGIDDPEGRN